ncbi:hypothetical protein V2J09_014330 [Rumex salicifolius]
MRLDEQRKSGVLPSKRSAKTLAAAKDIGFEGKLEKEQASRVIMRGNDFIVVKCCLLTEIPFPAKSTPPLSPFRTSSSPACTSSASTDEIFLRFAALGIISASFLFISASAVFGFTRRPSESTMEDVELDAIEATPESFAEFGQVIEASPDDQKFGPHDAQLDLSQGIPRFYIMHLEGRSLKFSKITHHASVTQCLGSAGGHVWYLAVAKPSIVSADENTVDKNASRSRAGHFYVPPDVADVRAYRISGSKFLKLNKGTWHAGPLFMDDAMDFYNLELSNTNLNDPVARVGSLRFLMVVDHTTHNFGKDNGVRFVIKEND